ncbi:MAG: DNA cytosine methyltransferase [Verrucomicrobiales bacterium]
MRSIELFSGAGGLALGLEAAGFESVALVEHNRHACATLRRNRPRWNVIEDDIDNVRFREFENIDLIAGGPPCQPFSMGGKAKGFEDHRDMFPAAVGAVRALRPKAFVFENVRGLTRPAFKNYVEFIRLQLSYPDFPVSPNIPWDQNLARLEKHHTSTAAGASLAYKVTLHLADAADFGVPQRRHRVFFVGFRSDVDAKWHFPATTHHSDELLRAQYVTAEYWDEHGVAHPPKLPGRLEKRVAGLRDVPLIRDKARWRTVRDAIRDLGDARFPAAGVTDHFFQAGARSYPGHTGSPLDEPSKALKAGDHGVPGGENMLRHPDGEVRYFSIREAARLQTFPDDWEFAGAWTESMRQLGNAVPVRLAEAVVRSVATQIAPHGRRRPLQSAR